MGSAPFAGDRGPCDFLTREAVFTHIPTQERFTFMAPLPPELTGARRGSVPMNMTYSFIEQKPNINRGGHVPYRRQS
jgi:hypothetical protein